MAFREALADLPETVFVDVLESDDGYLLVVDLPGVSEETVDVTAADGRLQVEARRAKDVSTEYRFVEEERSLFLDATLPLPPDADADGAEGDIDRGVLALHVPKASPGVTTIDVE
jgi:HSP20 family molecular chaperone IbpA